MKITKLIQISFYVFLISCGKNTKEKEHKHDQKENTYSNHDNHHDDQSIDLVHLTPKQIELAGIEVGSFKKRPMSEVLEVTGEIQVPPQSNINVYAPLEAFVEKSELLLGDYVKKGDVIAVLTHPSFLTLQSEFIHADNQYKAAQDNYKRKKNLFDKGIISEKSYQEAIRDKKSSQALYRNLELQVKRIGINPDNLIQNGVQEFIYIKSPASGHITKSNVNKGKYVGVNEMMYEIIDNNHLHADLKVFAKDISKVKKGAKFEFKANGQEKVNLGIIELVGNKVDKDSRTVKVHGHFNDTLKSLKAGMYIDALVYYKEKKESYTIEQEGLIEDDGEYFVFLQTRDGDFEKTKVEIGLRQDGFVEILDLSKGDFQKKVAIKGAHYLKGALLQRLGRIDDGHNH